MSNLQDYFGALTPARERRLQKRANPASLTDVDLGGTDGGIILNMSETGMAVAVAHMLVVGQYLPCIRFQLPIPGQSIEISAEVVWLAESKKGAGIRFVDLTADARNQIANWIASEKPVPEIEPLPKPFHHDKQPLEVSSRKFRRTFSSPSVREEVAAERYAEMFPSESTYDKRTTTVDEINPQQSPLPIPVRSSTNPGDPMLCSAGKTATGEHPETFSLPQVQTDSELVAPSAPDTPVIFDLSGLQVAALVFLFAVIGLLIGIAAMKAGVDALASLGHAPLGKQVRSRSQSPHTQSASGPSSDSAPIVAPTETSSAQTSRSSVDLDSTAGANTVGSSRPPEESAKEGTRNSEPSVNVPSTDSNSFTTLEPKPSADPEQRLNRNDLTGLIAGSVPLPSSAEHTHSAVAVGPIRRAPRNRALLATKPATAPAPKPSPPMASLKHAYPTVPVGPRRSTASGNPGSRTAKPAAAAMPKPSPPTASLKHAYPAVAVGPRRGTAPGNPGSRSAKPAAAAVLKPSVARINHDQPAVAAGPKGAAPGILTSDSARPAATVAPRPSPPPANSEPANPAVAGRSKDAAPGNPAPPTAKPATPAVLTPSPPANSEPANPAVAGRSKDVAPGSPDPLTAKPPAAAEPNLSPPADLVTVPSNGSKPLKLVFPQKQIAFSSSLAIITQLSVLVPPQSGPAAAQPSRLQAGKLVSYVLPRNPRPGDQYGAEETVKVHATIGQQGLVTEIRPVSGPIFLLSSAMSAIRLWSYEPTLLNERPVQAQLDVTIEFRLPR